MSWQDYKKLFPGGTHTVTGNVRILRDFFSPQLNNRRDILVYLPPSYADSTQRYPVIYMHDGQNLFDQATSFAGEWEVDETMAALSVEGLEAIVVGIPNMGSERLNEYSPFRDTWRGGGKGRQYVSFIASTLKPLIDSDFRTLPDRNHTGIIGSSMGGLISLFAFFRYPQIFGYCGALSPAFWFASDSIFSYIKTASFTPGKIYIDVGTQESSRLWPGRLSQRAIARRYVSDAERMYELLIAKGYTAQRDICFIEEEGAHHNEAAWARRLPVALRFLLRDEW